MGICITQGDFGFGWQLDLSSVAIETDVEPSGREAFGVVNPFRVGTRVFVTLPDGTREGFTFVPQLLEPPLDAGLAGQVAAGILYLAGLARPAFIPDAGNTSTLALTGDGDGTVFINDRGEVLDASRMPFNPVSPSLAADYLLTTQDGAQFRMDGATGAMKRITDRNGNRLEVNASGITSRNPAGDVVAAITFDRDQRGRITKVTDPNGKSIVYTYDVNGDLVKVTDRVNATTTFAYDPQVSGGRPHFLTGITDARGVEVASLEFDSETGRITSFANAIGNASTVDYDLELGGGRYLQLLHDALGNPTEMMYDARGNLIRQMQRITDNDTPSNPSDDVYLVTVFEYDALDRPTRRSQSFEASDEDKYDLAPTAWQSAAAIDKNGNATSAVDALGNTSYFTYDPFGYLKTATDPLGNTTRRQYDDAGQLTMQVDALGNVTSFAYDSAGNRTAAIDALNNQTTFAYDGQGLLTGVTNANSFTMSYSYDDVANRTSESYVWVNPLDPQDQQTVSYLFAYDDEGRMTTTTDEFGNASTLAYDEVGRATSFIDRFGGTQEIVYDVLGNPIQVRNRDGTVSQTVFDALGRATVFTFAHLPGAPASGLRITYDALGRIATKEKLEDVDIDLVADPQYAGFFRSELVGTPTVVGVGQRTYDGVGRLYESIEPDGMVTRYEYDALDRQTAIVEDLNGFAYRTEYEYDAAGRVRQVTDPTGRVTRYVYDALGRVVETIFHDESSVKHEYDALSRVTRTTDQAGRITDFEYDAVGNRTAVILPQIDDPYNPGQTVRPTINYAYDAQGNLLSVTDPEGRQTQFRYDPTGLLLGRITPLAFSQTNEYDSTGMLTARVDGAGRRVEYDYDALGRVVEEQRFLPGAEPGAQADEVVSYNYDGLGRIDQVTDSRGVTDYNFDGKGRLVSVASPEGIVNYEWSDDRDLLTRTFTYTVSDQVNPVSDIHYTYDALRRLETVHVVKQDGQAVDETTTYHYGPSNEVTQVDLPNGVVATYLYNGALGRLSDISYDQGVQNLAAFHYVTNAIGQRTQVTETINGVTRVVDYTYDSLSRLIEEDVDSGAHVISYTYDLAGNRLSSDDSQAGLTTYVYDADGRLDYQTLGNVVTDFIYDDAGAMVAKVILTDGVETGRSDYEYDARGMLAGADVDGDGVFELEYVYDANGALVGRTVNGVVTSYVIDTQNPTGYSQVIEEWTAGDQDVSYVYGLGPISQTRGGIDSTYLTDGLGSVIALTDGAGAITDTYTYGAFGEVVAPTGSTDNVIKFTGERFDSALGQYELRARRYDPSTGRFTTADPLQGTDPAVLNQYVYALGDPVNYVDPTGQFSVLATLKAVFIAADIIAIAFPVYRAVSSMNQLLDITDFVHAMRRGLDAGWMPLPKFMEMHDSAKSLGLEMATSLAASLIDIGQAALETFAFGQMVSWAAAIGEGPGVDSYGDINEAGTVEGVIEVGDATVVTAIFTRKGAAAFGELHHLIPQAALRRLRHIRQNLVALPSTLHRGADGLHEILRRSENYGHLVPKRGRPTADIIKAANKGRNSPTGYLDELGEAYAWLEREHAPDFDGITLWYRIARQHIGAGDLIV